MNLTLTIPNLENVPDIEAQIPRFQEIFSALISSGGLSGVKSGKTVIHFGPDGRFEAIQLDYYPYRRRSSP